MSWWRFLTSLFVQSRKSQPTKSIPFYNVMVLSPFNTSNIISRWPPSLMAPNNWAYFPFPDVKDRPNGFLVSLAHIICHYATHHPTLVMVKLVWSDWWTSKRPTYLLLELMELYPQETYVQLLLSREIERVEFFIAVLLKSNGIELFKQIDYCNTFNWWPHLILRWCYS